MFLENYSIFEQIGIVVAILFGSILVCIILQFFYVMYYVCIPFKLCIQACSKCHCRSSNGREVDWDEYSIRCPCGREDV